MILESKLVERLTAKLKAEDDKAIELMASGNLRDFGEYQHGAGYRKAMRDAKTLLDETYDELMKE